MKQAENDLVSVIVITYNAEKYIAETLDSIKNQTYKKIELIVSDDKSTDNSLIVVKNWVQENKCRFANVQIVEAEKNGGVSANCNRGYKASSGKYIKMIGSDDILLNNCIEDNYSFAEAKKAEFIYSNLAYFGSDPDTSRIRYEKIVLEKFIKLPQTKQLKFLSRYPTFTNSPTWFIAKALLDRVDGYNDEFIMLDDQHFAFKAIEAGGLMYYLDVLTVNYRVHGSSVSRSPARKKRIADEKDIIYKKYRAKHLSFFNIKDVLSMYDHYLTNSFYDKRINRILKIFNPLFYKRYFMARLHSAN